MITNSASTTPDITRKVRLSCSDVAREARAAGFETVFFFFAVLAIVIKPFP